MSTVRTIDELRALYGAPSERSLKKQMLRLDKHAKAFVERSPFVLIASSAPDRLPDVSPKGDRPGFVAILDDETIAIPDRPGNKRLDTYENVIENPEVGLLFLVPGMNETLRINGDAEIRTDKGLLERFSVEGKNPISALVVTAREVYLHCAKAFMRSSLWDPATFLDRNAMPSMGAMLKDQIGLREEIAAIDRDMETRYKATLY